MEYRLVRPGGEVRIVNSTRAVRKDALSQPFQMLGTVEDITDRKRAEEQFRRSEAYLAEARRLCHTGSFGWKPDTGEIVWSDETCCIFEYDRVKPTIDLVAQRVHPEDRAYSLEVIHRASGGATHFEHTYRLLLPDGRVKHVHALAHALQDPAGNREFVGAGRTITSIKRAKEELRQSEFYLADGQRFAHMGSWAFNPSGFFEYWSHELFQIFGRDPEKGAPTLTSRNASLPSKSVNNCDN